MKWTIKRSSLSLLAVLILMVGQLPYSSASNQAVICAGAGGLMVGVGAGLGKHPPAGSNNGYSSIVFQPPSQGVLVIEMDFRGIKEMDFFIYCVFWRRYRLSHLLVSSP